MTKVMSLNAAALYYGRDVQASIMVVKHSYKIVPKIIKAGGDGM
jgi:hypothetical protein